MITRPARISGFCSMKQLGLVLLPSGWMLVHRRVNPSIKLSDTHVPGTPGTWVE